MPLCFSHHREVHDISLRKFAEKYGLKNELESRGLELIEFPGGTKWILNVDKIHKE